MNTRHAEQSLDLRRAGHALHAVEALQGQDVGHYVSYVRALPANILQNGLGQALAMLRAAAKRKLDDPHGVLHDQMQRWLCGPHTDAPYQGQEDVLKAITDGSERAYLHAHAEALAYLIWLKKFAVAFLKEPGAGEAR